MSPPLFDYARRLRNTLPPTGTSGRRWPDATVPRVEVASPYLLGVMLIAITVAFGAVYYVLQMSSPGALWSEAALALAGVTGLSVARHIDLERRHVLTFVRAGCFVITFWFISVAAHHQFSPTYAVGLLFIIPGIGALYSLSLRHLWSLAAYYLLAGISTLMLLAMTPSPGVDTLLFVGALSVVLGVMSIASGARLRAHRRFSATEERHRAVIEQASDGIYLLDAETLHFLDANPSFQKMVGYDLPALRRMEFTDLLVADDAAAVSIDHPEVRECALLRKDGSRVCVELHVDKIVYGNRPLLSVVVHDVGLRRQYEKGLVAAKEKAEEIAQFKSSLLTNMSHEIRTPLSSILGWSSVLRDEVSLDQRELLSLIEQSGRRLHATLDNVLELAHLDAKSTRLQPVATDVRETVEHAVHAFEEAARRKQLTFRFVAPANDVRAYLDPMVVRRILTHIIDNAIKFTDEGEVTVEVSIDGSDVRLNVTDTGVGIGISFLPHVFDEFRQESQGLSRDHEGTGLGLSITRRLVDLLGGSIDIESTRGHGTTVTVLLPGRVLPEEAYRQRQIGA